MFSSSSGFCQKTVLFDDVVNFLTTVFCELVFVDLGVVIFSRKSVDEVVTFFEVFSQLAVEVEGDGTDGFNCEASVGLSIGPLKVVAFPSVVAFPETGQAVEDSLHRHLIVVIGEMILCHRSIISVLISMTAGKN